MSLQQILLVLKREYMTRIRSKAFIIATILIPLGMVAFIGIVIGISLWDSETQRTIGIQDNTEVLYSRLNNLDEQQYQSFADLSEDSLRSLVQAEEIDGYLILDESHITGDANLELVSSGAGGLKLQSSIRSDLREVVRDERLDRADVSEDVKEIYASSVTLETRKLTQEGEETEDDTGFLTIVGVIMGVIIFGAITGYGGLITRSVIEEKTNRIIEVIASSVKPIELLLGKLCGIGALAITQMTFWIASFLGLAAAAGPIAGMFLADQMSGMEDAQKVAEASQGIDPSVFTIPTIETSLIIYFIVFFILGYLIYSALFAAIGSAVDSETDTQQYMIPIMVPIMVAYLIMFQTMENPDSMLSVVGSLVPFCTPIVMITRIAITDVPIWQIGLSILLMIATFGGTMWLSAKIYSVGILSYGKSASFKELIKWIRQG
ncbi:ABC transporter permease [Fodinibius halophilus]|uniref:ABC transporter permease n=1 Tax=Fodinibius halophilus TaxID=1736908 RepID=A0A6M1SS42_9BACT|nr:ABC transporter permease [Fodinibius halophilus]NGP86748.1 ABC transporter permease [Fodinibius halophilus]